MNLYFFKWIEVVKVGLINSLEVEQQIDSLDDSTSVLRSPFDALVKSKSINQ